MNDRTETHASKLVSVNLEVGGQLMVIENVPAQVDEDTGERLFEPAVVERMQAITRDHREPTRVIETPVYNFVA